MKKSWYVQDGQLLKVWLCGSTWESCWFTVPSWSSTVYTTGLVAKLLSTLGNTILCSCLDTPVYAQTGSMICVKRIQCYTWTPFLHKLRCPTQVHNMVFPSMDIQCSKATFELLKLTRLRGKRGKLNYNWFLSDLTHNFLDHPSNQEVNSQSPTVLRDVSNIRSTMWN